MGFESFRVELRSGPATHAQVDESVRQLPNVKPDPESIRLPGSTYYTVEDEAHVIELEVADSPVRVSCRFTLCHPPSVDAAFLRLVRELMVRLGMEARICDDVPPQHAQGFPATRFPEFADAASRCISTRRAEWVSEVYERIILPRCVPVTG
jgi:hypothetical protein